MSKYEYLKEWKTEEWRKRGFPQPFPVGKYNKFSKVTLEEIEQAEAKLGFQFPSQLREFYLEIGDGYLVAPYNTTDENYHFGNSNEILPPMVVAEFYKPLGTNQHLQEINNAREKIDFSSFLDRIASSSGTNWITMEAYEDLPDEALPFFHIGDSVDFLIMLPHSSTPNAVWDIFGNHIIEESFEKFIWRLYYEDPAYYY